MSLKDIQVPSSQRGLCWAEIPNEEFAADIPRGAPNLYVTYFPGGSAKVQILLISSDHTTKAFSYRSQGITVLSCEFYPRPVHYRQKRAASSLGHCDPSKLSRVAGQYGPTIRFWGKWLSRAASFGMRARVRQPISEAEACFRCGMLSFGMWAQLRLDVGAFHRCLWRGLRRGNLIAT